MEVECGRENECIVFNGRHKKEPFRSCVPKHRDFGKYHSKSKNFFKKINICYGLERIFQNILRDIFEILGRWEHFRGLKSKIVNIFGIHVYWE
jgi:hypothetical protein